MTVIESSSQFGLIDKLKARPVGMYLIRYDLAKTRKPHSNTKEDLTLPNMH